MLDEERFSTSRKTIARRQSLADEMRRMLTMEGDAPTQEFFDIDDIVDKVRVEGTFLDTAEVVRLGSTLSSVASTVDFVRSRQEGLYPRMNELCEGVESLSHIVREIARIVDEFGNVRDSASPTSRRYVVKSVPARGRCQSVSNRSCRQPRARVSSIPMPSSRFATDGQ